VTDPVDDKRRWIFKTAANDAIMAGPLFKHMKSHGLRRSASSASMMLW